MRALVYGRTETGYRRLELGSFTTGRIRICAVSSASLAMRRRLTSLTSGLHALQHRGQESAGIVVVRPAPRLTSYRAMGLVADVFTEPVLEKLEGPGGHRPRALLHGRGAATSSNAQPYQVSFAGGQLAVAHNGNFVNADGDAREARGRRRRHLPERLRHRERHPPHRAVEGRLLRGAGGGRAQGSSRARTRCCSSPRRSWSPCATPSVFGRWCWGGSRTPTSSRARRPRWISSRPSSCAR